MASSSIFRSLTLPNGKPLRTMREDVMQAALRAVKEKAVSQPASKTAAGSALAQSNAKQRPK